MPYLKILRGISYATTLCSGAVESYNVHKRKSEFENKKEYTKNQAYICAKSALGIGFIHCIDYSYDLIINLLV